MEIPRLWSGDSSTAEIVGVQYTGGAVPGQFANVSGSDSWRPGPRKPRMMLFTMVPAVPRRRWTPIFVLPSPGVGGFVPMRVILEKMGFERNGAAKLNSLLSASIPLSGSNGVCCMTANCTRPR
jgi:hypothetical protein